MRRNQLTVTQTFTVSCFTLTFLSGSAKLLCTVCRLYSLCSKELDRSHRPDPLFLSHGHSMKSENLLVISLPKLADQRGERSVQNRRLGASQRKLLRDVVVLLFYFRNLLGETSYCDGDRGGTSPILERTTHTRKKISDNSALRSHILPCFKRHKHPVWQ